MKKANTILKAVLIFFLTSAVFLMFSVVYSSIKTSSLKDLSGEKERFEKTRNKYSELRDRMKDWENVENEYLEFKDKYILRFGEFSTFRKNLELLISRNSLSNIQFRIEYKKALRNEFIKVNINLKLAGKYANLKKFIYDIVRMDKMVYFQSIRLSGSGPGVSADLNMGVYLVK